MTIAKFEQKIKNYIEKNSMLSDVKSVILAVSGGKDSVALLYYFARNRQLLNVDIKCVHIEHGLRGEASLRDAYFVENLCEELGVSHRTVHVGGEITRLKTTHVSVEEAARLARYSAIREDMNEGDVIATAHHANDNAETVLLNLIRGTGIEGMGGIKPCSDDIIRPFLFASQEDILKYLGELGADYVEDETNASDEYARNIIRNHVMPELEKINERSVSNISEASSKLLNVSLYLQEKSVEILNANTTLPKGIEDSDDFSIKEPKSNVNSGNYCLKIQALRDENPIIQAEVVRQFLKKSKIGLKDVTSYHINQLVSLISSGAGKKIDLPRGYEARRGYEEISLVYRGKGLLNISEAESGTIEDVKSTKELVISKEEIEEKLASKDENKAVIFTFGKADIIIKLGQIRQKDEISSKKYTKSFDYDKINGSISLRHKRDGDVIQVRDDGSKQKLSRYFINEKVPKEKRGDILLVADDDHVMWAVGYRMSAKYKITDSTTRIITIEVKMEDNDE